MDAIYLLSIRNLGCVKRKVDQEAIMERRRLLLHAETVEGGFTDVDGWEPKGTECRTMPLSSPVLVTESI